MSELDKEKILKNGRKTFDEIFYRVGRLSKQIEAMNIDENNIKKDDVVVLTEVPTVDNTELKTVYQYQDKLYVKVFKEESGKENVLCYTDIFLELVDANNRLAQLSETLDKLEE